MKNTISLPFTPEDVREGRVPSMVPSTEKTILAEISHRLDVDLRSILIVLENGLWSIQMLLLGILIIVLAVALLHLK